MISGLPSGASYEEKCRLLSLDTLEVRRIKQDLLQTFKILKGIDKVENTSVFSKIQQRGQRVTRAAGDPQNLTAPRARTDIRKNSFFVRSVYMWNQLPADAKNTKTVREFKNSVNTVYNTGELAGGP